MVFQKRSFTNCSRSLTKGMEISFIRLRATRSFRSCCNSLQTKEESRKNDQVILLFLARVEQLLFLVFGKALVSTLGDLVKNAVYFFLRIGTLLGASRARICGPVFPVGNFYFGFFFKKVFEEIER